MITMEARKIDFRFINYLITDQTLYIRSAETLDAVSEVAELEQTFYIMQDGLHIINQTCIRYGSSYKSRVTSVRKLFKLKQNPPIPLDPHQDLYAFPTHSPRRRENIWIITKNIKAIEHRERYSIIHYKNGVTLTVQLSKQRMMMLCAKLYEYYLFYRS